MSFTHVPAIWANGPSNPTQKFVLLALADFANDEGGDIWPEIKTVAQKCGLSEATVIRAINGLVKDGYLIRKRRRSTSNMYQIVIERLLVSVKLIVTEDVKMTDTDSVSVNLIAGKCQNDSLETVNLIDDPIPINQSPNHDDEQPSPVVMLQRHFTQKTAIQPNEGTGRYQRDWSKPLEDILAQAGNDPAAAIVLIDAALAVAWGKNESGRTYTVSCPRSIVTIAANQARAGKADAAQVDTDSIWNRALDAITRRDFSDSRLKAAIRAIGGTNAITSANGHDTDKIKLRLANEYRRVSTPA